MEKLVKQGEYWNKYIAMMRSFGPDDVRGLYKRAIQFSKTEKLTQDYLNFERIHGDAGSI